jgi:hypothetical protein
MVQEAPAVQYKDIDVLMKKAKDEGCIPGGDRSSALLQPSKREPACGAVPYNEAL